MVIRYFWKPKKISAKVIGQIAAFAIVVYAICFSPLFNFNPKDPARIKAAETTEQAFAVIGGLRSDKIISEYDPLQTGIIGLKESPLTSKWGKLEAKQTTVNPNWTAVFMDLISRSGASNGDAVVLGLSGSFPALNIAAVIAAEALNLKPIVISSVMASQWGANDPDLSWLDMERVLFEKGLIKTRSLAASIGGLRDRAMGMPPETIDLVRSIIKRNGIRELPVEEADQAVNTRLALVKEASQQTPIRAYVNIGGGQVSLGGQKGRSLFRTGLNDNLDLEVLEGDDAPVSMATAFVKDGATFVNVSGIKVLAKRFSMPWQPKTKPVIGKGPVFYTKEAPRIYAAVFLILLSLILVLARYRLQWRQREATSNYAVPAVAVPVPTPVTTQSVQES